MKRALVWLLPCFFWSVTTAQVPVGSWRTHAPMSSFDWVGETETHIYAANTFGILAYDREDGSLQSLTKVNVLSGTGISCFECNAQQSICIVGYANGNLDIIRGGNEITNQPAIMNSNFIGDKSINDVFFDGDNAWLATGIGVILLDLNTGYVSESTPITHNGDVQRVKHLLKHGQNIVLSTDSLVLSAPAASLFTTPQHSSLNIPIPAGQIGQFFAIENNLYAVFSSGIFQGDTLYKLETNSFVFAEPFVGKGINHVQVRGDKILVTHSTNIVEYNLLFEPQATLFTYGPQGFGARQALYSEYKEDQILVADRLFGGVEVSFANQFNGNILSINSPKSGLVSRLAQIDDEIIALPGGTEHTFLRPIFQRLSDNTWESKEILMGAHPFFVNGNVATYANGRYYMGANRGGIAVLGDDLQPVLIYDATNSPLEDLHNDYHYHGVTGIDSDDAGNVYVAYNSNDPCLKVLMTSGSWVEFTFPEPELENPSTGALKVLDNGMVAVSIPKVGLLIFDPNNTPENPSDDRHALLTTSPTQGGLPSSEVLSIAQDNDGELWIGTSIGIGIIYNIENVFEAGFGGVEKPIVNQGGYNGYLFEAEAVSALAVDGANRKWVGTEGSGLFLVSADGQEQIARFSETGSPLPSNRVSDLAIMPTTGEVFVATEQGLVSYRSDATAGATSLDNIAVFPNPVLPNYTGVVSITNLTHNAQVRITNASGNLVFETRSLGGQATWGGTDMSGQRVESGVYLVHVANADGSVGKTEKIFFLR